MVSGVPPDAFSETGQLWGSPLFKWEVSAASHHTPDKLGYSNSGRLVGQAVGIIPSLVCSDDKSQVHP